MTGLNYLMCLVSFLLEPEEIFDKIFIGIEKRWQYIEGGKFGVVL